MLFSPCATNGIVTLDISQLPTNVVQLQHYDPPSQTIVDVEVVGDYIFAASQDFGFSIFNATNYSSLSLVSNYTNGTAICYQVEVSGDYAYCSMGEYGLDIINISDVTNPTKVLNYYNSSRVNNVVINGTTLYTAGG